MLENTHYYYEHFNEDFIHKTFLTLDRYSFKTIGCIYIYFELSDNLKYNIDIYKKLNIKIYEKFIKIFNKNTITFTSDPQYYVIYIYNIDKEEIEHKYIEFYNYIHRLSFPISNIDRKIIMKAGIYYSYIDKDPLYLLRNAYEQYLYTYKKKCFMSMMKNVKPSDLFNNIENNV